MNNISYRELLIGILVLILFVVSVSVGYLSCKTDVIHQRVDSLEYNNRIPQ